LTKKEKKSPEDEDINAVVQFLKGFVPVNADTGSVFIICEFCKKYPGHRDAIQDGYCDIRDIGNIPSGEGFCKGFTKPDGISITDGLVSAGPEFFECFEPGLD